MKKIADEKDIFSLPEDVKVEEKEMPVRKKDLGMSEEEYEKGRMYANIAIERIGENKLAFVYRIYRYGIPKGFVGKFEEFKEKYPELTPQEWQKGKEEIGYPGYGGARYKSKEPGEESDPEYGRGLEMKVLRPRKERWKSPGERGQEGLTFKTTPGLITDPSATPEKHMENILGPGKASFFGEGYLPLPRVQGDIGDFKAGKVNTFIKRIWASYVYDAVWAVESPPTNAKIMGHLRSKMPSVVNVFSKFFSKLGVDIKEACPRDEHVQNLIEESLSKKANISKISQFEMGDFEGEDVWVDMFDGQIYGSEQAVLAAKEGIQEQQVSAPGKQVELPISANSVSKLVKIADKLDFYNEEIANTVDMIIQDVIDVIKS